MKRPESGMSPGAFRNALRGNPDGNRIGLDMLLDASGSRFQGAPKSDKMTKRRKAEKAARRRNRRK